MILLDFMRADDFYRNGLDWGTTYGWIWVWISFGVRG
jgi:hypothetical protein